MIAQARRLTASQEDMLVQQYQSGASIWQLQMSNWPVTRQQLTDLMHSRGIMRPRAQKSDPSPEEIEERAAEVRAEWSEEEAKKRYVGRGHHHFQSNLVGDSR